VGLLFLLDRPFQGIGGHGAVLRYIRCVSGPLEILALVTVGVNGTILTFLIGYGAAVCPRRHILAIRTSHNA